MVLFGIILIGLIIGRIAKFALQQSSRQFSVKGRLVAATSLDGHLVTEPNGELANKTIQNIGKRL